MGIDTVRYHGWRGRLHSPWFGALAIARVGLTQVLRRKLYWLVIALGMLQFLAFWTAIYIVTQIQLPPEGRERFLGAIGFAAEPEDTGSDGYTRFMDLQSLAVMLLLAFSGNLLVGSDFQNKTLPFYLSRRIDRRHYIVGKLLAISSIVALLTVAPALLLFLEYGMFTTSLEYWSSNWRIPLRILGYGAVMCAVLSILLASISAYLQRMAPIAITWSSLFVLANRLSDQMYDWTDVRAWRLCDPWFDVREVGQLIFASTRRDGDANLGWQALLILLVVCSLALAALTRRVRAVDVVG
jgi:ABC-2 type transport system permease protein